MSRIRTQDVRTALEGLVREGATKAAGSNQTISRTEQKSLDPVSQGAAEQIRNEKGSGARITVDEVVARTTQNVETIWNQHNPPSNPADAKYLSRAELRQIETSDPKVGALTRQAVMRLSQSQGTTGAAAAVQKFLEGFDFRANEETGVRPFHELPGATKIDARSIFPDVRASLPAGVLSSFDFYGRAMDADWATVTLQKAKIDGHDVHVVYCTTDGDEEFVEILDKKGAPLLSARVQAGELVGIDEVFGRVRLSPSMVAIDDPAKAEGYSEPADRAAAGQIPLDWTGDVIANQGRLNYDSASMRLGKLDLPGVAGSKREELACAAFEYLFALSLKSRLAPGGQDPFLLGPTREGTLRLGEFVRPSDGKKFEVADWKDIDDGSFTLYFDRTSEGRLKLAIEQFNN